MLIGCTPFPIVSRVAESSGLRVLPVAAKALARIRARVRKGASSLGHNTPCRIYPAHEQACLCRGRQHSVWRKHPVYVSLAAQYQGPPSGHRPPERRPDPARCSRLGLLSLPYPFQGRWQRQHLHLDVRHGSQPRFSPRGGGLLRRPDRAGWGLAGKEERKGEGVRQDVRVLQFDLLKD